MNISTISPEAAAKLAKIVARLASDHAGERAAAALKATEILRSARLTWRDAIEAALRPPPVTGAGIERAAAPGGDGRDAVVRCWQRQSLLNAWELRFVTSLRRWRGPFTARQREKLRDIVRRLREAERRPSCAA